MVAGARHMICKKVAKLGNLFYMINWIDKLEYQYLLFG